MGHISRGRVAAPVVLGSLTTDEFQRKKNDLENRLGRVISDDELEVLGVSALIQLGDLIELSVGGDSQACVEGSAGDNNSDSGAGEI